VRVKYLVYKKYTVRFSLVLKTNVQKQVFEVLHNSLTVVDPERELKGEGRGVDGGFVLLALSVFLSPPPFPPVIFCSFLTQNNLKGVRGGGGHAAFGTCNVDAWLRFPIYKHCYRCSFAYE